MSSMGIYILASDAANEAYASTTNDKELCESPSRKRHYKTNS